MVLFSETSGFTPNPNPETNNLKGLSSPYLAFYKAVPLSQYFFFKIKNYGSRVQSC